MNNLRELRKEIGMTQEETAKLLGVSRRTYQTYEEKNINNNVSEQLFRRLKDMGILGGSNVIPCTKVIKDKCASVFKNYPEVECAYLYGSYARREAKKESDIDILVVCPATGMRFYKMAADLEDALHKKVDLQTHRQIAENSDFLKRLLIEGIKIYG